MPRVAGEPTRRLMQAEALLREALQWVTDKPWDDDTLLHKRISEFLGEPIHYQDHIKTLETNNDD